MLRLALVAWGLGHLALGRRVAGGALLIAEVAALGGLVVLTVGLADTTHHLIPYVAGMAFIGVWAWQAVAAYHAARSIPEADATLGPARSPATAAFWLSLPLLVWGTGFWVAGAGAASPAAVLDHFLADWTRDRVEAAGWPMPIVDAAARSAEALADLCERGTLRAGCDRDLRDEFRDVRIRVVRQADNNARASAEAVRFERRDASFLGIFAGSQLVPVPVERVMTLELEAEPATVLGADIGARRWRLVDAR